jgi:16S rRNA (guanine966-N2)-methyltransferase
MDNRRYTGTNPGTSYNQNRFHKKQDDRNYGERRFQPRSNDRYPPRDRDRDSSGGGERFQPRDGSRFQSRDRDSGSGSTGGVANKYAPRGNGGGSTSGTGGGGSNRYYQARDNRYQPRENRYPPRDDRFRGGGGSGTGSGGDREQRTEQRRDNRYQPRGESRYQPRENRDNRFPPRKNFFPRGAKPVEPWKSFDKPKVYSEMQVTDGKHRGKFLQSTASPKVRPTARRIREVMFRLIFRRVRAGRFLDLCAGCGAVGIEAISRGALLGTFVERSAKMCSFIKKNMEACGIKEGHGEVCEIEVVPFLKKMAKRRRFWDVVYYDPPYDTNYEEVLEYLKRGTAVKPGGLLVIEHHAEMFFPEKIGVLRRSRVISQGETALSFYERKS